MNQYDKWLGPATEKEIGFLFSYFHFKDTDLTRMMSEMPYKPKVFVDSGGFTASYKNIKISVDEYARFIRKHGNIIDNYANIDEIGNATVTLRNQLKMEALGLRPLPVIHFGTKPSELVRYHKHGYDYMCLGGLVPQVVRMVPAIRAGRSCDALDWLDECFLIAKELGIKLHGFGCTTWDIVHAYPWASIDSASWAAGYMWGALMFWDLKHHRWRLVRARDPRIMRYSYTIRPYGVSPTAFIRDSSFQRADMLQISIWSWLAAQRHENALRSEQSEQQITVYLAEVVRDNCEYAMMLITNKCTEVAHAASN